MADKLIFSALAFDSKSLFILILVGFLGGLGIIRLWHDLAPIYVLVGDECALAMCIHHIAIGCSGVTCAPERGVIANP